MSGDRWANPATAEAITVLLIEDDLVDEMATLRAIAREGLPYCTEIARSVAEARSLLAHRRFDVILADYQLSDGNSFDLMDDFADDLVIFITGAWDEAAAAMALRLGVHDYLIKDTDRKYLKLLNYRVETALRQRRTERQLRDSEARLRAILDNAPAAISVRDMAGRLLLSNRHHTDLANFAGLADLAGLAAPTAAVGLSDEADVTEESGSTAVAVPPPATAHEREESLVQPDGSQRTYHTVHFPIRDADGVHRAMGAISVDITARKQAEEQIRNLAYFDPLTALPNRRMLLDRLQQALAASARHGNHGALFFIDLDHFKALNDTLGHDHGDMLLVDVASRLLACVRGEDTVARIGGDEFVVMAVSLSDSAKLAAAQAMAVGEKLVSSISRPCQLGNHTHSVTPSIGVTLFHGRELSLDEIIKRADLAMYQAKAAGRGTLRFFDPDMQAAQEQRRTLEADLRSAVAADQLRLVFQGQIDAQLGTVGAEVLLRWQHPSLGMLLPEQFLQLAEQSGQIVPIGQWVIEAACAQLGLWAADPHTRHLQLAVNVSTRQFRQADFVEHLTHSLLAHGADPGHLRLELREALIRDDPQQTLLSMAALRAIGVHFAMDEFGMGLSSLAHLKRLPLDQIKMAQALLCKLTSDPHDVAVVKTIISMGRELGLTVMAAGVETVQQQALLHDLGCGLCQGHLLGRPVPLAEFEQQLVGAPSPAGQQACA